MADRVRSVLESVLRRRPLTEMVLYHGSPRDDLTSLRPDAPSTRYSGEFGIYTTPRRRTAEGYGRYVYALSATPKNPLFVDDKSELAPHGLTSRHVETLRSQGYDAIVVGARAGQLDTAYEIILFASDQVRELRRLEW